MIISRSIHIAANGIISHSLYGILFSHKKNIYIHTHTYTHTYTYSYTHIHTHTYTYETEYYSAIKKENNGFCSNTDEPRGYHASVVIQKEKENSCATSLMCDT